MKRYALALVVLLVLCGGVMAHDASQADSGGSFVLPNHFLGDLVATFAFGLLAIGLLALGYKVFDWIAPCDYDAEISKGNMAAAVTIVGVVIGLSIMVATVIHGVIS